MQVGIYICAVCLMLNLDVFALRKDCLLPIDKGLEQTCTKSARYLYQRFAYNALKEDCQPFEYFGCGRNANNFRTYVECIEYCNATEETTTTTIPPTTTTTTTTLPPTTTTTTTNLPPTTTTTTTTQPTTTRPTENVCDQPMQVGNCGQIHARYYFDNTSAMCKIFHYSGCGGNGNRFTSQLDCCKKCGNNTALEQCGVKMMEYQRSILVAVKRFPC